MENPATWGRAERVVHGALLESDRRRTAQVVGLSTVRQVTDALRREGLLRDEDVVTMRSQQCDGHDGAHAAHPYDWTGPWLWCEGSD